ncbi:MAG: NAD(P)-binding protein [Pseudomonadota bacterium]
MSDEDSTDLSISRRSFINSVGVSAGAGLLWPEGASAKASTPIYPPALTGMRGSHPGSFEWAHARVDGHDWQPKVSGEQYDLVVVGAGISGLAAAYIYRRDVDPHARILILENHDDFGGHARRNELIVDGRAVLGFGGSMMMVTPQYYPDSVKKIIEELGINIHQVGEYYDRSVFHKHNLTRGCFLDAEHFGQDFLAAGSDGYSAELEKSSLSKQTKQELKRLFTDEIDYLAGNSQADRRQIVDDLSWHSYLKRYANLSDETLTFVQKWSHGVWAIGADALPAWLALLEGYPGFAGMDAGYELWDVTEETEEATDFYFPDGNASIARLLLKQLIPEVAAGTSMTDIVDATFNYSVLDQTDHPVRLRLNSTVFKIEHINKALDADIHVDYINQGQAWRVRAKQVVWAGYHAMLPHVCDDIPPAQQTTLSTSVRAPFVYVTVAIRQWQSMATAGVHRVYCPGSFFQTVMLTHPVSMGRHKYATGPEQPMVLHLQHVPLEPGLPAADQFRAGRQKLLSTTLADFQQQARNQLQRMFKKYGFDADRDIAAITVNRWAHGYAFSADPQTGKVNWWPGMQPDEQTPWITARQRVGNMAIAGSDAASNAMAEAAIEEAMRAVQSLNSA